MKSDEREKLRRMAERLCGGDPLEAEAVAGELERMARGPGRPPATLEKHLRRVLSDHLHAGEPFPGMPAGFMDSDTARAALKDRTEADDLAAELLAPPGKEPVAGRTMREARKWRAKDATPDELAVLVELLEYLAELARKPA